MLHIFKTHKIKKNLPNICSSVHIVIAYALFDKPSVIEKFTILKDKIALIILTRKKGFKC